MKRIDQIVAQARRQSDNERFSDTAGISDEEVVYFLTSAQTHLQSLILQEIPGTTLFDSTSITSLVSDQRVYPIAEANERPFMGLSLRRVEYSSTGDEEDYFPLERRTIHEFRHYRGTPVIYDVRGSNLFLNPIPSASSGYVRTTYPRQLDDMDKRRGKVSSTTNDSTRYTIIELAADPAPDAILDDTDYYVCISDKDGAGLYYNIPISSYDTATRRMTVDTGALVADGTIPVGSWVTYGKFTSTHSGLPDACERYLVEAAAWKLQKRDSTVDSLETNQELNDIKADIIRALQVSHSDTNEIPITNDFFTF